MSKEVTVSRGDERNTRWLVFGFIVLLTIVTRYYKVTEPDHVCWDETHFGKMGSWYINRTFFFDVHPPLGKMLIGLSGALTGYNGTYPFDKPGDKYNGTAYEGMRIFCTTLGALIVPMSFDTVHDLTGSVHAALISASYILFDVGMITLNQYILLDPILLFFMSASIWGMVKVRKNTNKTEGSFSLCWWFWLFFTGTMLACTISVKFVGLFVVLLAGLYTIDDLWTELGNLSKPVLATVKQLLARAIALIIWPILLYMILFYIHLTVLNRTGNGDGFYSSAFQSRLIGNSLHNASMPREVAYGALVTLKNHKTGGGYLHSHHHLYPKGFGARQQQITTYTHKDENNRWLVKPYNAEVNVAEVRMLKNGQLVRLEHLQTKRNMHSHQELAPMTKKHYQVTGYGENGTGDANDIWKVVVPGRPENETIKTVTTKFMLVHYLQNCALTTSGKQLPKWAYEQQEVSCNPNIRDKNALWNIEDNVYEKLPNVSFQVYAPGFLERFFESHFVMFQGNAGLKPKEGEITSKPWQWPINYRGQFFSGSAYRIYLLGNPVIWWSNLVFLALFVLIFCVDAVREQRKKAKLDDDEEVEVLKASHSGTEESESDKVKSKENRSLNAGAWLFVGWLLHYLPFWAMGRVLYFHHYFPALIFNSLLTGIILEYMMRRMSPIVKQVLLAVIMAVLVYSFVLFSPLAYGMSGPSANEKNSTLYGLRWLDSWEF